MNAKQRNFGLDVMRATAILLVILSHYFSTTFLKPGGIPGVEIFFILSGFLIGDILIRSYGNDGVSFTTLLSFWTKRWFRTLPNYAAFLIFHLVAAYVITSQLQPDWYLYALFLRNFITPMPEFFQESWSLAVEEWFYLLFPLLLLVINRGRKLQLNSLLAVIAVFLVVPTFLRWYVSGFWTLAVIRMVMPLHLDALMYGVMMAVLMKWKPALWKRAQNPAWLIPAVAMFAAGLVLLHHTSRGAAVISFSLIDLGVATALPFVHGLQRTVAWIVSAIEYVSKVSYSTYLLHLPFFFFAESLITWGDAPVFVKLTGRLLMIIAVLLLSYLPYKYIEQPFLQMRQRLVKK